MDVAHVNKNLMAYGLGRKQVVEHLRGRKDSGTVSGMGDLPRKMKQDSYMVQVNSHVAECILE